MKKLDAFKLSLLAVSVAGLGVGCASSGYARMDNDGTGAGASANVAGVGASASTDIGTDSEASTATSTYGRDNSNRHYNHASDRDEGASRITVSALSFVPETRANFVNKFPFYDRNWRMVTIDTYTFAVPDPHLHAATRSDLPEFSVDLPPGSVFVESAGGAGEVRTGRVIEHSPMLSR